MAAGASQDLVCDAVGIAPRDHTGPEDLVLSSLWAWRKLPAPLRRFAWTSRGYFSVEQMATMCGVSADEVFEDANKARAVHTLFLQLDEKPVVEADTNKAHWLGDQAPPKRLWMVSAEPALSSTHTWRLLPPYLYLPLERAFGQHTSLVARLRKRSVEMMARGQKAAAGRASAAADAAEQDCCKSMTFRSDVGRQLFGAAQRYVKNVLQITVRPIYSFIYIYIYIYIYERRNTRI